MRPRVHSHHPRTPTLLSTSRPHHGGVSPTIFVRAATTPTLPLLALFTEVPSTTSLVPTRPEGLDPLGFNEP